MDFGMRCQEKKRRELLFASVAFKLVSIRLSASVSFQRRQVCEGLATVQAGEHFLSNVDSFMHLFMAQTDERPLAELARKELLVFLLDGVQEFMGAQPRGSVERLPAHVTLERLNAAVSSDVKQELGLVAKPLQADAAHKVATAVMGPLVFVKVEGMDERKPTLVADIRLFSSVLPLVALQVETEGE